MFQCHETKDHINGTHIIAANSIPCTWSWSQVREVQGVLVKGHTHQWSMSHDMQVALLTGHELSTVVQFGSLRASHSMLHDQLCPWLFLNLRSFCFFGSTTSWRTFHHVPREWQGGKDNSRATSICIGFRVLVKAWFNFNLWFHQPQLEGTIRRLICKKKDCLAETA